LVAGGGKKKSTGEAQGGWERRRLVANARGALVFTGASPDWTETEVPRGVAKGRGKKKKKGAKGIHGLGVS